MELPIPQTAKCLACGYPLRGLSVPTCPECGHPFDPQDTTTYDDGSINIRDLFIVALKVIGIVIILDVIQTLGTAMLILSMSYNWSGGQSPYTPGQALGWAMIACGYLACVWALLLRTDWIASRLYATRTGMLPTWKSGTILAFDLYMAGLRLLGLYALILCVEPASHIFGNGLTGFVFAGPQWSYALQSLCYLALAFILIIWTKPIAARLDKMHGSTPPPPQSPLPPPNRSTTPTEN